MEFSVVVPTHNRLESLKRTLDSLFRMRHQDREIIVVNDGCTDGTVEYVRTLASGGRITLIEEEQRGPAAARNAGVKAARGRYVAFTDDDCVVPTDWLQALRHAFESSGGVAVGGTVQNQLRDSRYSRLSQEITNFYVRTSGAMGATTFLTSNNLALRSEAIRLAGGFDERFRVAGGEERALLAKIASSGGMSFLYPEIVVDHYHEMNAIRFLRQQHNYGRGAFLLHRVVGRELAKPTPPIPIRVQGRLLRSFFKEGPLAGVDKSIWFLLGQLSALAGFAAQAGTPRSLQTSRTS